MCRIRFLGLLCFFLASPCFGQAVTSTQVFDVPISLSVFVPCAAGGAGELIDTSGRLHVVLSSTVNGNNVRVNQSFNPQDVVGTGETTGDTYHSTGVTRFDFTASVNAFPTEFTFVNNFYMIGQLPAGCLSTKRYTLLWMQTERLRRISISRPLGVTRMNQVDGRFKG